MPVPATISAHALRGLLPDLASQPGPLYRALSSALAALVLDGRVASGLRLPSDRDLANELGVSRATAIAAYNTLADHGLVIRRRGSGSYLQLPAAARVSGPGSRMARGELADDTIDLSIASLPAIPGVLEPALASATDRFGRFLMGDGYHPYGLRELRSRVAERYTDRGVPTLPENILIVNGAQHGFDIILRTLLLPGDRVVTELPTYPGALEAIRMNSGRTMAVPLAEAAGWDVEAISRTLQQSAPRLAYLMPDFQNPTGALINEGQRRAVVAAARRSGTRLVIDESFVDIDLRPAGERTALPPAMAALDSTVLSVGSLSKPVWGGLRVGWIRADADTIQRLAAVRARTDMAGAVLEQLVAHEVLADLDALLARRCSELRAQLDVLLGALAGALPQWQVSRPAGGLSAWVQLDAPAATTLTHLLEQRGILISPGSRFAPDASLERYLRIPFALGAPALLRAVAVISETWAGIDSGRLRHPDSSLVTA
jgi:DNA-binding transcriptional MocR family regulator